jgi:hypothetical protein
MFFACLSSADPSHAACVCVCVISMHISADSFAVGSRALVNICYVFIALFCDPVVNIIPCEKIRLGPDREIF